MLIERRPTAASPAECGSAKVAREIFLCASSAYWFGVEEDGFRAAIVSQTSRSVPDWWRGGPKGSWLRCSLTFSPGQNAAEWGAAARPSASRSKVRIKANRSMRERAPFDGWLPEMRFGERGRCMAISTFSSFPAFAFNQSYAHDAGIFKYFYI